MLGWESTTYGSADGWQVGIYKADGSGDGHLFTELDLALNFRDGFHFDFKTPTWSTINGSNNSYHTQIEQYCPDGDIDPDSEHTYSTIEGLRPSILSQLTTVSRKKSWNGSIETRVLLKNRFTDGKEEEKTIVNDASKVLEEVERFKFSVVERHNAIGLALWELRYRKQKQVLDFEMIMEDEGVD